MARVKYPVTFEKWKTLFKNVFAKHTADGAGSVLNIYLSEQSIDLTADNTKVDDAVTANIAFSALERGSEELSEGRDNLFKKVFKEHTECVQFLKKLYRNNVQRLGEWGVTVDNRNRVVYPADFVLRKQAVTALITQHGTFSPPTSPLQVFIDENFLDLAANQTAADSAEILHTDFMAMSNAKEEQRELRDELIIPVEDHVRGIGQFLVGLYPDLPHTAGEWGYTIDSSPQGNHIRTFKISSGEIETVQNVALNSDIINKGSGTVYLKPHNKPDATPVALEAGKKFRVIRGYGSMDIDNSSGASDASIEAMITK